MRKIYLLVLIPLIATALSSCSVTPYGVKVGTSQYSQSQLITQINEFYASPGISGNLVAGGISVTPGTRPTQVSAGIADTDISLLAVNELLRERHVSVTSYVRSIATSELITSLGSQSSQGGQIGKLDPGFKKFLVDESAASLALGAAIERISLTKKSVTSYYESHPQIFRQICLQDALFSTQAEAQSAIGKIQGGSSFASSVTGAVESTASNSTPSCGSLAGLSPNIASAVSSLSPNQVTPPIAVSAPPSSGSPVTTGYVIYYLISSSFPSAISQSLLPLATTTMLQRSSPTPITSLINYAVKHYILRTQVLVNPADGIFVKGSSYTLGYTVKAPQGPATNLLPSSTTTSAPGPNTNPLG